MKWFITYGDDRFVAAKSKIVEEAKATGVFDKIVSYGNKDLSEDLLKTDVIKISRGGGLWSWKPDVIWSTMQQAKDGDIIVYCDSGCSLQKSKEWDYYFKKLNSFDLIAQRLRKRTDRWTRKELLSYFKSNGKEWEKCYQYQATVVIMVNSPFSRKFVKEWRDLMIDHPEFVMDVTQKERVNQHKSFKENRHDQAIFSALIYKYRHKSNTRKNIYTKWEHIEDYDFLFKQAIRATRLRQGELESKGKILERIFKRLVKDWIYKPFFYIPLQYYYGRKY